MQQKHDVIIGGGFAGNNLTRSLAGRKEVRITLVDRNNYNYFQPLLSQVATGCWRSRASRCRSVRSSWAPTLCGSALAHIGRSEATPT